jgi:hypothetical protein
MIKIEHRWSILIGALAASACQGAPNPLDDAPIVDVNESASALAGDDATLGVVNTGNSPTFAPGERRSITIAMNNSGTTTWFTGGSYMLHWVGPTFFGWGDTLVSSNAPPSVNVGFTFSITAPSAPGTYTFRARMISYSAAGGTFFGQLVSIPITVAGNSVPDYDAVISSTSFPSNLTAGQTFTATVVMTNTGGLSWPPGKQVFLYNRNSPVNTWGQVWSAVTTTVAMGQSFTFKLKLKAPASPPSAYLWQMYLSGVSFFGQLVNVPTASGSNCPITNALAASYLFENDVSDSSGHGNTGVNNGASFVSGAAGFGIHLSGVGNSNVTIPPSASLTLGPAYTYSAWFRLTAATGGYRGIISADFGGCCYNRLLITPTDTIFYNVGEHRDIDTGVSVPVDGSWNHIALTYDESTIIVYLNGGQVFAESRPNLAINTAGMFTYIGAGEGGGPYNMNGDLDDVRIYDLALTAADITSLAAPICR